MVQLVARPLACSSASSTRMHSGMPCGDVELLGAEQRHVAEAERARAAVAGNSAVRSSVAVKMMLTRSSCVERRCARSISFTSRCVLASISAFVSSSHVIAPRSARSSHGEARLARGPVGARCRWRARAGRRPSYERRAPRPASAPATSPGASLPVAQRADARAHQAAHRMADRLAHAAHLAVAALVDDDLDARWSRRALLHHAHPGRRGRAVVELDALAQRGAARPASGTPSTSARYSFSTPWLGCVSSCVRSPSLVSRSRPSVS